MITKFIQKASFGILLGFLCITQASANSIFSFHGLGNSVRRVDARARAMGGAGRAVIDGLNFSTNNPALLAGFQRPSMSAQFITQRRGLSGLGSVNDGDVGGFHIVIPMSKGSVFGASLEPLTDMDFGVVDTVGTGDLGYEMELDASGGMQAVSLGFGQYFGNRFYGGVRIDWLALGTFNERWNKTFFGQNVFYSSDDVTRTQRGWIPAFGVVYAPTAKWSLAADFQVGREINQRTTLTTRYVAVNADNDVVTENKIKMPSILGGGIAYLGGYRWLAALDVERGFWEKTQAGRFNTWDISAGVLVRTGSPDPLVRSRRWEFNGGVHYRSLYLPTTSGKQVGEVGASLGLAVPFKNGTGRFRYVLEFGKRGNQADHGVSETFIQQSFSVTGFFQ